MPLLICGGCEQILGIEDVTGKSTNPMVDGGFIPPRDAPITPPGDGSGSTTACAPLPAFGTPAKYGVTNVVAFAVGDVDRDSFKDLVVVTRTQDTGDVMIFKGSISGNGGLGGQRQLHPGTPTIANGVLIADVDNDGSNDIVTWDTMPPPTPPPAPQASPSISVHRQNLSAAGTFLAAQSFAVTNLRGVVAGKLNGDLRADLVVMSRSPDDTFPYFASTTTAGAYTKGALIDTGKMVSHVTDIDGDGLDDVAFTAINMATPGISISFNNNAVTPGTFTTIVVGSGVADNAAFGHFTGQPGRKDAIKFNRIDPVNPATLYAQTSPRVFEERAASGIDAIHFVGIPEPGTGMQTVDINSDGREDVTSVGSQGEVELQCPTPLTFYPSSGSPVTFGPSMTSSTGGRLVDLDTNGKPDYVVLTGSPPDFVEAWLQ